MPQPHVTTRNHRRLGGLRRRRGTALILSLLLLLICQSLAFAFFNGITLELKKSENLRTVANARLAAESGLDFALMHLMKARLPGTTTEATFPTRLQSALAERLNGTANLAGQSVYVVGTTVYVPEVQLAAGRSFSWWLQWSGTDQCRLTVRGAANGVSRDLKMDLKLSPALSTVFDYGLASRGPIEVGGNTRIIGVNDPQEATVFSATTSYADAIKIVGSGAEISGDLYLTSDMASVSITGSPTIAGETDPAAIAQHIHTDQDTPDFPELNVAPIAALATNPYVPGATVMNNVRIPAGTNPNFNSDMVLNGVIYIESPNKVKFNGHATVNAIIVTEDSQGAEPISACQLTFAGTVDAHGVGSLPDTPEFAGARQQTGSFILAGGFAVNFLGNFSTINGSVVADQIYFGGTSEGTIKGSVVGLKDVPMALQGNVDILVDKSDSDENPAGIIKSWAFVPIPDTYREFSVVQP